MRPVENRYAAECCVCDGKLDPGAGVGVRFGRAGWAWLCPACREAGCGARGGPHAVEKVIEAWYAQYGDDEGTDDRDHHDVDILEALLRRLHPEQSDDEIHAAAMGEDA